MATTMLLLYVFTMILLRIVVLPVNWTEHKKLTIRPILPRASLLVVLGARQTRRCLVGETFAVSNRFMHIVSTFLTLRAFHPDVHRALAGITVVEDGELATIAYLILVGRLVFRNNALSRIA